uniref:Adhesion G protein-coupled receptor F5 n=1 Tax=Erpetoichthys calabaricus TaxID=27687 RepID=A0A8C4S8A1_ERPCA
VLVWILTSSHTHKFINIKINAAIVSIAYLTLSQILPNRSSSNSSVNSIIMTTTVTNGNIYNISLTFQKSQESWVDPLCVFWNFSLFNNNGGWDASGCKAQSLGNSIVCVCEHLTTFSVLMSPETDFSSPVLDNITYVGLAISMASLILCLIIEGIVWHYVTKNKTSYIRHISIINIAFSLLMADTWFIIGAAIDKSIPACSAVTFFTHFFYLSLFFWMLSLALLLLFRIVMVFKDIPKSHMMAIAFSLGYGCPLIIAVVTIAVTAPKDQYKRSNACWLSWENSMALLAFVIPALIIIAFNLITLCVVIFMLLRRTVGDNPKSDERNTLKVVARSIGILTPLLGLTWGFGIGTVVAPKNIGINMVFTILNALQVIQNRTEGIGKRWRLLKGKTGSEIKGVGLMKVFSHRLEPGRDITGTRASNFFFHRLGPGSDFKRARWNLLRIICRKGRKRVSAGTVVRY